MFWEYNELWRIYEEGVKEEGETKQLKIQVWNSKRNLSWI